MNKTEMKIIGNSEPYKLTTKSALNLIKAIVDSNCKINYMVKDTTLPDYYVLVSIEISPFKIEKFESTINYCLEDVGEYRGQDG